MFSELKGRDKTNSMPWYRRAWFIISATVVVISAIIMNAPEFLQNTRILPSEVQETIDQFQVWVKEDSEWTGSWSSNPEGIVDAEDMNLSDTDMKITILASKGSIDGTIATKNICKAILVQNYILLRGKVFGSKANVVAWDIVKGKKMAFAKLKLVREGNVITVIPIEGLTDWFPEKARLGKNPVESSTEPDQTFCEAERRQLYNELTPKAKNG